MFVDVVSQATTLKRYAWGATAFDRPQYPNFRWATSVGAGFA